MHSQNQSTMESLGNADMSAELEAQFKEHALKCYNFWKENVTQEQKDLQLIQIEEFKNNPAKMAEEMALADVRFAQADANGDGRLNLEEFVALMNMMTEAAEAKGNFATRYPGQDEKGYELYNAINPSQDGFTKAEYYGCVGRYIQYFTAIKAADEAQ